MDRAGEWQQQWQQLKPENYASVIDKITYRILHNQIFANVLTTNEYRIVHSATTLLSSENLLRTFFQMISIGT